MSSDSDDDCYGNIAQKLQSIKRKYQEHNINSSQPEPSKPVDKANEIADNSKPVDKVIEIANNSPSNVLEELKDISDCEDISLDAIIAQNTKHKPTSKSKRKVNNADISTDNIIPTRGRKRSKASKKSSSASIDLDSSENVSDLSVETPNDSRRRGRGRQRGHKSKNNLSTTNPTDTTVNTTATTRRTRNTRSSTVNSSSSVSRTSSDISRAHRGRQSSRRREQISLPEFLSSMFNIHSHSYPTYSVGNTDEYQDESYDQPLFTNQSKKDEVIVIGENEAELNDTLDENEELSVKVYWQNRECIKFTIRRFQKLQSIFDFFANRENVTHDKLFFTYNDKILKMDDTPESVNYNIAKFIDGGITNQSVLKIVQKDLRTAQNGIKLKFQCQNVKKPYEIYIQPEDKLASAMLRCAEHFEKPLEKLKFLFDGDTVSGKNTPKELDLEGGECFDVKIIS